VTPEEAVRKALRGTIVEPRHARTVTAKRGAKDVAPLTDADWDKLQDIDPGFAFFEKMPDRLLDTIESTSRRIRTERLSARA